MTANLSDVKEIGVMTITQDRVLLFSYGTLQDKSVQVANFGRELAGRPDSILGYAQSFVVIDDPEVLAMSGKTRHPIVQPSSNPQLEVLGTVFEITAQELLAADEYEVSHYKRISASLKSGSQAWVYVRA
jgi:hypothetical protein